MAPPGLKPLQNPVTKAWARLTRHSTAMFILTLALGVTLALAYDRAQRQSVSMSVDRDLLIRSESGLDLIGNRFLAATTTAQDLSVFLAQRGNGTSLESEFRRIAPLLNPQAKNFELISLAVAVPHAQRSRFELTQLQGRRIRSQAVTGSQISPAKSEYVVVQAIYPMAGNEEALGLDLDSEQRRSEALRKATETKDAVLSSAIVAVQDAKSEPTRMSTMMALAIPSKDSPRSFITAIFRYQSLADAVNNKLDGAKLIRLADATEKSSPEVVWEAQEALADRSGAVLERRIHVAGGRAILATFVATEHQSNSYVLLISNLLIAFLCAMLVKAFVFRAAMIEKHRKELQELAAEMAAQESEL